MVLLKYQAMMQSVGESWKIISRHTPESFQLSEGYLHIQNSQELGKLRADSKSLQSHLA